VKVRFGEFTFDRGRRLLFRGPDAVRLPPKAFQLLELLLEKRPDAVSKEDIQKALWPDSFVSEASLVTLVKELRRALGDSAGEGGLIRTAFGFGYAFDGQVHEAPPAGASPHRHVLVWGMHELMLREGENVIGRDPDAAVWVGHSSVSRRHARVVVSGDQATIEDLGSKNGTRHAGRPVPSPEPLVDRAEVRVGEVTLTYLGPSVPLGATTKTAR
jgi:DNA-binding winged helix-turn-helix (wHTH) protein